MKRDVLGLITARGGSKGLKNKNILKLANHPLIAYSIKAALDSKLITRCIVSTDCEKIAEIALKYGAEVPFLRPAHLAEDTSIDLEVFQHALNWLKHSESYNPELMVHLRPTSPIRKIGLLDDASEKLINSESDSLRVVTQSPITPYKMWTINNLISPMQPLLKLDGVNEPYNEPRQRLPKIYWQVGTLDIVWTEVILKKKSMSGDTILPYIIDYKDAVDIDDIRSFEIAESVILNREYVRF